MLFKAVILSVIVLILTVLFTKLTVKLMAKFIRVKNYKFTGNFYLVIEILIIFAFSLYMGERLLNLCF